ncbi:MAG: DUF460 domain-containing protein [Methanomicrobiaceae archaeon]|nr:DUF460 domain-containing protein [Methanomicrobiaceae archaeon]
MKVFGIDIIKGSVRSGTKKPVFALVKREGGKITGTGEVSLFRLIKELESAKPDILAVDSIREISVNQQDLIFFMQSVPGGTRLVQVTGGEKQESLPRVAARYNIKLADRFDPFSEAKTTAHVAELGAGCEVIAFENTCDITVSRSRSIGKGGWSQNRYIRKIHGAVLSKSREIEDTLREKGLRYEKSELKGFGGYKRVHFHVFASKNEISVQSERHSDFQVRVVARKLDRIRYSPQTARKKHIIVGIDPGTTFGIAALSLEGELLALKSSRQMSLSDWTEEISSVGKPVVIASDVQQMPASVEKIRRAFKAVSYTPKEERTQEEKASLCTAAGLEFKNDHERDSLAAALEAYKSYKNRFKTIEKRIPPGYDLDLIRAGIIRGLSVEQIISEISPESATKQEEEEQETEFTESDVRISHLEGMIKDLRNHVSSLQEEISEKNKELESLKRILKAERTERSEERRKSQEIAERDAQIKAVKKRLRKEERNTGRLLKQIQRLKRFADLQMDADIIPVKILSAFTREGLRLLDDDLGVLEGDIIFVSNTEGWGNAAVSFLSESHVAAVIAENFDKNLLKAFREEKLPLLSSSDISVTVRGRTGTINREKLKKALSVWNLGQDKFENERKALMIESIVKEYKSEREVEARRRG